MPIKHAFTSGIGDPLPIGLLRPGDWNADHDVDAFAPSGLTGATEAARFVGGTVSGAPVAGTFAAGDYVIDQSGLVHICAAAGSPGIWIAAGGTGNSDRIWIPGSNPYGLDDEFNDASIDGSWTQVNTNRVTWTEGADVLSVRHTGSDGAAEMHAIMKSMGSLSPPVTIETATRYLTPYAYAHFMLGPLFADGTTYGAGVQVWAMPYTYNNIAVSNYTSIRRMTGYNTQTNETNPGAHQWTGGSFFTRLVWSAANTWHLDHSVDGVSWIRLATSINYSLTPTHVGIATSTWTGGAPGGIGSIEYFRVY